ncbi:uncharacterized protein LOC102066482 [Zonotrichia albicollis]|uniref:uncharacterized protein LOC102066482 n=1 Tax=Zonotrichia albicollis TaxID=44394 RepID=UPI003D80BBD1
MGHLAIFSFAKVWTLPYSAWMQDRAIACKEPLPWDVYPLEESTASQVEIHCPGTNWLSQILTDLIAISQKKTPGSESSVNAEEPEEFPYLEIGDAEKYERMTKLPSPRFMVTHLRPENLPKSIFQNNAKILLLIRNPKDVATSFYHFCNGLPTLPSYETWDDFFADFMTKKMAWGCYFEYLSEWNKYADKENIMTITYEEVKENRAQVVKNIATFFGIPLTEEQLQLVVERSSFQSMKKNSDKTHGSLGNVLFRKGSNWLSQILTDLIAISQKKTPGSESTVNAEEPRLLPFIEIGNLEKYERMTKLPSPRFLATHLRPENLPKSIFKTNAKILLLIRNPKDVATSYYHFSNGLPLLPSYETWDDFFTDFMTKKMAWGCYFEYLSEWNKYADKENIMTITYEEVKENPALSVKNIATFFGIPLTEEQLQLVVERSSFQSMKKNSDKTHGSFGNIFFRKEII